MRAKCEPLWRRTAIATASSCSVFQTLHNDAVAIAVCRRSSSHFGRVARAARTPKLGVRMVRAARAT
eukprot:3081852-Lingulodinium_polyedra.AAC.1